MNWLASATSSVTPGWGQSYASDGFGNLTNQTTTKGSAPGLSTAYDPATNRQTGDCADANGNLHPGGCYDGYVYDVENRLTGQVQAGYVPPIVNFLYSYAPGNKRVWRGNFTYQANGSSWNITQTVDEVTFWGANGQKLATYALSVVQPAYEAPYLVATQTGTNYYFGGKLIKNTGGYVTPDRLGSIGKYFPYGQERPSATQDGKEKFATYFRDSETGLDYADQRYHQPGMGRFMSADPYAASGGPNDPGSWNRYAYTRGDPVNRGDPSGLDDEEAQCAAIADAPGFIQGFNGGAVQQCADLYPDGQGPEQGGGGFYDPNPSVFANDLGSATAGNSLDFSSAYDLNNGTPGFGPDPGVPPPPPPDCQGPILNAVNNQFGTNLDQSNILPSTSLARQPGGQVNLDLSVSGGLTPTQFNAIQAGRYAPPGLLGVLTGYGPSLHVVGGASGLDPNALTFTNSNIGGVYSDTFTVHIDSAWANNPIGFILHVVIDVLGSSTRPSCP